MKRARDIGLARGCGARSRKSYNMECQPKIKHFEVFNFISNFQILDVTPSIYLKNLCCLVLFDTSSRILHRLKIL